VASLSDIPERVLSLLEEARHLAVLTGAGISAESGVPTFRDALTGYWSRFRAEDLATPEAFARHPERVSRWYDERRGFCTAVAPNPGHRALAELERRQAARGRRFSLVTQNVDRLHQRAGSREVVELHGSLWVWRCLDCGDEREESGPAFADYPPRCACGGLRRPGVVWFGESLPGEALTRAQEAVSTCDLLLSVGTSGLVYPAAELPYLAARAGIPTVEVNPEPTAVSDAFDYRIRRPAGQCLPCLLGAVADPGDEP